MATSHCKDCQPKGKGAQALDIGAELDALASDVRQEYGDDGLMTVSDIVAANPSRGRKPVLALLKKARGAGRLKTGRVLREDLAGRITPIPAYRILPKGKARKEEGR